MEIYGSKLDAPAAVYAEARSNRTRPSSAASHGQLARLRQTSITYDSVPQPQGSSNWIQALHNVRAGQPGNSFEKLSLFRQTDNYMQGTQEQTESVRSLVPTEKKMRPQTAHIRSATNYAIDQPIPEKPVFGKSFQSFSNRNGSAVKKGGKSLQRVQSANLKMKRKLMSSRRPTGGDMLVTGKTLNGDSVSVQDVVGYDRGGAWAIKAYRTPGTVNDEHRHVQNFLAQEPKISGIQQEATRKKAIPDAAKYPAATKHKKWSNAAMFCAHMNGFQKFLTADRVTLTDKILARRSLREPGPSTYKGALKAWKHNVDTKLQDVAKSTTEQLLMLDAAKFRSKETPGAKYKINHRQTSPRSSGAQLYPVKRVPNQQIKGSRAGSQAHIIKKSKAPCIGTYEEIKSIEKTQQTTRIWHWGTQKKGCKFIEQALKSKTPGPGSYAKSESGIDDCLSRPLMQFRKRKC